MLTPWTMPQLKRVEADFSGGGAPGGGTVLAEDRLPLQNDAVHHAGQHLAVVVAETLEQARHAASLVRVTYEAEQPLLALDDPAAPVEEPDRFFGEDLHDPLRAARPPGALGQTRNALVRARRASG